MVNKSKRRGTAAESAVVSYLVDRGWPHAERRALQGSLDKGDVAGVAGVMVEVKDCVKLDFGGWLKEALTEKVNAKAKVGVVWAKRKGKADAGEWYVVMTGQQFCDLLIDGGYQ